jgi:hypothetical protein
MNFQEVIASAKKKKYLIISEAELNELLANSKLMIEESTYISDKFRLLKYKTDLLIQEKTTKHEYLIRVMKTKKEAEDFIKDRLEIYNRMWDGCGCKVKYYD